MALQNDLDMAKSIAERVAARGGHTYFVGGCVRDTILGAENKDIDLEVTIPGNGSVTIKDIPVGTYTVTEKTDWSWRYNAADVDLSAYPHVTDTDRNYVDKEAKVLGATTTTVPFANSRTNKFWLSGDNYKLNLFDGSAN